MGIIYKAVNKNTGKIYVGQTWKTLEQRRSGHEYYIGKRHPFYTSMAKHGKDAFEWSAIDSADDQSALDELERKHIILENSKFPNGYNLTDGGRGIRGFKHDVNEVRARVERRKGKPRKKMSEQARLNISLSQLGKKRGPHSSEHSAKIGAANRGKKKPHAGVPRSPETRAKIAASLKKWNGH